MKTKYADCSLVFVMWSVTDYSIVSSKYYAILMCNYLFEFIWNIGSDESIYDIT